MLSEIPCPVWRRKRNHRGPEWPSDLGEIATVSGGPSTRLIMMADIGMLRTAYSPACRENNNSSNPVALIRRAHGSRYHQQQK